MDPLSIAVASSSIAGLCVKVARVIYTFIEDTRTVDSSISDLLQEILGLSRVSETISQTWTQNSMIVSAAINGNGNLWASVKASIDDCKNTLGKLDAKIEEVNTSGFLGLSLLRKPAKLVKLNMKMKDIVQFKEQFHSYNNAMQSALQMITVCLLLNSNSSQDSISNVLTGLKTQISMVQSALQKRENGDSIKDVVGEDHARIRRNLYGLVQAAESFHSNASVIMAHGGRSTIWGGSVIDEPLSSEQYRIIQDWIPQPIVEENEHVNSESSATRAGTQMGSPSGDKKWHSGEDSDADSDDIERHLTQNFEELALKSLQQRDYEKSETFLQKLIERSAEAEMSLARITRLNIWLSCTYGCQRRWEDAERILVPIAMAKGALDLMAFCIVQALAVAESANGNHDAAIRYCKRAAWGMRRLEGKTSHAFYLSMALLSHIYQSKGDSVEAEACRSSLPGDFNFPSAPNADMLIETVLHDFLHSFPDRPQIRKAPSDFAAVFGERGTGALSIEPSAENQPKPAAPINSVNLAAPASSGEVFNVASDEQSEFLNHDPRPLETNVNQSRVVSSVEHPKPSTPSKDLSTPRRSSELRRETVLPQKGAASDAQSKSLTHSPRSPETNVNKPRLILPVEHLTAPTTSKKFSTIEGASTKPGWGAQLMQKAVAYNKQRNHKATTSAEGLGTATEPSSKLAWGDAWLRKTVAPEEVQELLRECTVELKSRALDIPLMLLPFRPTSDPSAARTFIRNFFDKEQAFFGQKLKQKLRRTDPLVLCSIVKWCWSRIPGGVVSWNTYEMFCVGEQDSHMAIDSFSTFIPLCVESNAHTKIIFDFFDLLSAVAAHSNSNGFGGQRLSRLAAWWAFEYLDEGKGFKEGYKEWADAANATSHLFFAYLRSLSPESIEARNGMSPYPRSLQRLVQETTYPPERLSILQTTTTKVVMIVNTESPTPFALLRRANHFQYRYDDRILQELSEYEDPVKALGDECGRVLRSISSANQSQLSSSRQLSRFQEGSWSQFEDMGFSDAFDVTEGDGGFFIKSKKTQGRTATKYGNDDSSKLTTPSWADFLSSDFVDETKRETTQLLLPPDKILPLIDTSSRGRNLKSHGNQYGSKNSLEPGEPAAITRFDLDDVFWWVWISSMAHEETAERRAAFGRCVLVETKIAGGRWILFEEVVDSRASGPAEITFPGENNSFRRIKHAMPWASKPDKAAIREAYLRNNTGTTPATTAKPVR